ncbi:hypothetical protein [Streptomyces sp. NBC_00358]|uniref:hypothetical protein n=1 Tax=Streptomyces sp. NBC_00358 TaxID=2975725 RepID=UPI002E2639AC
MPEVAPVAGSGTADSEPGQLEQPETSGQPVEPAPVEASPAPASATDAAPSSATDAASAPASATDSASDSAAATDSTPAQAPAQTEAVAQSDGPAAPAERTAAPAEPDDAPSVPRARRRGRTTLLIATAAVLGLVAGTCAGYLVQADSEPTKLPSLSQPAVAQAKGDGPEPLSAAQDDRVKTNGDLRKLLLPRPKGTRESEWTGDDGWMNLTEYADSYKKPAGAFGTLVADEFRRAAVVGWRQGSTYSVEIRLVQYRQEESLKASEAADNAYYWAEKDAGTNSRPLPGTGDGMVYVHTRPETKAGYLPIYSAEAHAWRGDIAMEVWVYDTKPIPKEKIMDLAKRQVGRL